MIVHDFPQYSPEWWDIRVGRPSASVADKMVSNGGKASTQYKDLAAILASDMYAGKALNSFDPTPAMIRGTELEADARDYYSFTTDSDVTEIGCCSDDGVTIIASPDGIIENENGLLEIKNLTAKRHVQALAYYDKYEKPQGYYSQVQMQLMVCEADYCDLLFHYPVDLPSLIIRIEPDLEFHELLKTQIEKTLEYRDNLVKMMEQIK